MTHYASLTDHMQALSDAGHRVSVQAGHPDYREEWRP